MSITESIRQAPNPRPADFSMLPLSNDDTEPAANDGDDAQPGSPTSRMMRAIAPPNATVPDVKWPAVSSPNHDYHLWRSDHPEVIETECHSATCHYLIYRYEIE